MTSLSFELSNFTLSQSLQIHTAAVRTVATYQDLLLSGGLDHAMYLYRLQGGRYELANHFDHHTNYVYSARFRQDGLAFFSGGQDGAVFHVDLEGNVLGKFTGHTSVVCSIGVADTWIVTGSWDSTARIWDIATGNCIAVLANDKHSYAVCVMIAPNAIVTGSQNGNLNFWSFDGKFIRTVQAHSNIVRYLTLLPNGFLSCSNDQTVKFWSFEGACLHTMTGHDGFVFCTGVLNSGDLLSGGDDRCVKVWRQGHCIDNIAHNNSVWDIAVNEMNDVITAGADCFIRVFTKEESRLAPPEEISEYLRHCDESARQAQNPQGGMANLPKIEDLPTTRGSKEGDIKVFDNNGVPEAYTWHMEGEYWERIGEVVGNEGGSAKKYYPGDEYFDAGEYDYIFDVELGDGLMRKLPYRNDQNPMIAAEKFIGRENMNREYLQHICEFINKNAAPSWTEQPSVPRQTQYTSRFFPVELCLFFDQVNVDPIIKKLKEFNALQTGDAALDEAEFPRLDTLGSTLANPKEYKSKPIHFKDMHVLRKILRWHKDQLFPVFDIYRVAMLHYSTQDLFKGADQGGEIISTVVAAISQTKEAPILITGLRLLCNCFYSNTSLYSVQTRREHIIDAALNALDHDNKNVRLSLVTLLFNFSVSFAAKEDMEGRVQCLSALIEAVITEKDPENQFRALSTIGNLITAGGTKHDLIGVARDLGLVDTLTNKRFEDRAAEVARDLISLIR